MNTVIKYIRLPFAFSTEKLTGELKALTAQWVLHFNKAHYNGHWSALPLRSVNGSLENIIPDHHLQSVFSDTTLMNECPYIKSILENFPCEQRAVRLLKLSPGAVIKEHTDKDLNFENGEARIHIPITTNTQVEFYLDGERMHLQPGECWYMNFDLPHRIANYGDTDRIHLVMDILVNEEIRYMFENVTPEGKKIIAEKERYSANEKQGIIKQLRSMNTPTSIDMAAKMEAEN